MKPYSTSDAALDHAKRGWSTVAVAFKGKRPIFDDWHHHCIMQETVPQYFNGAPRNVGVRLGAASGGLTDIDLDCAEAITIAPYVLPKTPAIFGRKSKRNSHLLYITTLSNDCDTAATQARDPRTKGMLLELRIGGGDKSAQTVFPPSTHESGELIQWEEAGEPAAVDGDELIRKVRLVAACALMARYWPGEGGRHQAALIVGGFLARAGLHRTEARVCAEAIAKAAGDKEWKDRRVAADNAASVYHDGKRTYGLNSLREAFGKDIANKIAEWVGYQGGDDPSPLNWLNMSNWDNEPVPERKWAILNRVPLNQAGLLSGEGGTGKSIIELQKDVAHVASKDWLGSLPERGPIFYIGAEDDKDELHIRLAAIAKHYGVSFAQLVQDGFRVLPLLDQDATLCAAMGKSGKVETTALYKQIYEAAGDIKPKNISIDTLTRAFAGSEIDRVQVYGFAMHMQALAMVAGGAVTILGHPSLTGISSDTGISGSTAWHGAFRFRQYLKGLKSDDGEPPDTDIRELVFKKNQYGPIAETLTLRYRNGLFLPVAGAASLDKLAAEAWADQVFLDLVARFTKQNRVLSDKTGTAYAPTLFAREDEAKSAGLNRKALEASMMRLFKAEKIMNEPYGPPSRLRYRIVMK
jgi:RecA-family ATPase